MRSSRLLLKILGAFALGIFFSCAPNNPDPIYPQNRNVLSLTYRDLTKGADDSIRMGIYPDSLSGWRLAWELPEGSSLNGVYIFADTIPDELAKRRLVSGSGAFDPKDLPKLWASLGPTDTSWGIPSSFFLGKQGRSVRSDTAYWFSVWLRYDKDVAGLPVRLRVHLGDETPPSIPVITDSIGQTSAVLRIPRPSDQTSVFDTLKKGPISRLEVRWWPGLFPYDSLKDSINRVSHDTVPLSQLIDRSIDTFRLEMKPLRYYTSYMYMLIATDSVGLKSYSTPIPFTTRDSLAPSSPGGLTTAGPLQGDTLVLRWTAATDSFDGSGLPLSASSPNYRISKYIVKSDGIPIDTLDISTAAVTVGKAWVGTGRKKRFRWDGSQWLWTWPNLRPGKTFAFSVLSRDLSGNDSKNDSTYSATAPAAVSFSCPTGYVGIAGTPSLPGYCIEEREHRKDGVVQKNITWAEAIRTCTLDDGSLCSDSQWVRACESSPSGASFLFGSIETGSMSGLDSLDWLTEACQLATGDSSQLRRTASDPRCVSAWGVFDLPGGVAEWTRDVYHTGPGSARNPALAWVDTSDLTRKADLGTIHGGSWLELDQPDRRLASARCRERNFPAFSGIVDSLPGGLTRRRPNPLGTSQGVGFRCCRQPDP